MHGHSPTSRNEADDFIAGQRRATASDAYEHIALTADADTRRRRLGLAPEQTSQPGRFTLGFGVGRLFAAKFAHNIDRVDPPVAQRTEQHVSRAVDFLRGQLGQILSFDQSRQRDSVLSQLAIQDLPAEFAAPLPLRGADRMSNPTASAPRNDELQPILSRILRGTRDHLDSVAVHQPMA